MTATELAVDPDLELVRRAQAGDVQAFGDLVERNRRAVFRAALAAVGSATEADDVAQEAFVTAFQKLQGFRGDASFFRRKFWLVAAPVAAAAVIVLAVTAPWRDAAPPAPTAPPVMAQAEPPRVAPPPIAPKTTEPPAEPKGSQAPRASSITAPRTAAPRPDRVVAASDVPAVEDVNFTAIAALAGPQSIAIERLADPVPSSMRSIEPAPLEIRALEVTALPETPRERREE